MSNLDNREPVTLTIGQKLTVLSRTKILIKCLVTGLPKPVIAWNREENQLETSGNKLLNDSVLIIKNITGQDSGLYLCTASNLAGKVSAGSLVYVTGKGQFNSRMGQVYKTIGNPSPIAMSPPSSRRYGHLSLRRTPFGPELCVRLREMFVLKTSIDRKMSPL